MQDKMSESVSRISTSCSSALCYLLLVRKRNLVFNELSPVLTLTHRQSVAPYTLPVGGGFIPVLFHLTVLSVRHRPGIGVPNGPANIPP